MRIFEYAKVADWESRLQNLATMAEQERWTYRTVPSTSSAPVLDAYIRYTFIRIHEQGRIAEVAKLACFNTGLLTSGQEEIFGVFRLSDRYDSNRPQSKANKKWFLMTWARSGERILTDFPELPRLATYWTDPSELIFNPQLQVQPNLDHIIRDNLIRFPVELGGSLAADGVPREVAAIPDIETEASVPAGMVDNKADGVETAIPLSTRNALEGAIKHSVRLAQRSYRVAVPQYHRGRIQLLLPLYLRESGSPDLALTLERHGKWYRAATVLFPDWAYRHARLLSRPNSEWLGGFRTDVVASGLEQGRRGTVDSVDLGAAADEMSTSARRTSMDGWAGDLSGAPTGSPPSVLTRYRDRPRPLPGAIRRAAARLFRWGSTRAK